MKDGRKQGAHITTFILPALSYFCTIMGKKNDAEMCLILLLRLPSNTGNASMCALLGDFLERMGKFESGS